MNTNSYFTIETLSAGTVIIQLINGDGTENPGTIYYWINSVPNAARDNYDGSIVPSGTPQYIRVNGSNPSVGTIIRLYRPETTACCFGDGGDNGSYIRIHGTAETKVSGNMASLIGFNETIPAACFRYMFYSGNIVDASELELPWTTLSEWCFGRMFNNTKLIEPPYLPATTLADSCYRLMFRNCTALKKICRMACKNLVFASHYGMYQLCTALEKVTIPLFDTYANQALAFMFNGCSGLKELVVECPEVLSTQHMFYCLAGSCMNLERFTCLAKSSTANCTQSWLGNDASYAAENATFIKHPDATFWTTDSTSGIPTGWTVKNMNPQVQSIDFNDTTGVYVKGNQKIIKIYGQNNVVLWEENT